MFIIKSLGLTAAVFSIIYDSSTLELFKVSSELKVVEIAFISFISIHLDSG